MTGLIDLNKAHISIEGKLILSEVNLSLNSGEFVYLIGKVGSGKSSLLKTLYAELPLVAGKGTIAGYDLTRLKRNEVHLLRRKLGIVFQDFQLLTDRSVYKNLSFVLEATDWNKNDANKRIEKVLENVGLPGVKNKMPHELSGGQQQKIVIARALLNEPDVILADEPTGNLDPESADEIIELLTNIQRNGKLVLMATHNFSLLKKYPNKVIRLNDKMASIMQPDEIPDEPSGLFY